MSSTSAESARHGRSMPPDRLTAVLDEVDRARRTGGWMPEEPVDTGRRGGPTRPGAGAAPAVERRAASRQREESQPRHLQSGPADLVRPHTPLVRPPRSLRDAVVAPGRLATWAVIVLVLAAGTVLGGRLLWLRATSAPQPADPGPAAMATTLQGAPRARASAAVPTPAPPANGQAPPADGQGTAATTMLVHVVGQVKRPGVVTLPLGSRVRDALTAAGGARDTADLGRLNLARPVTDGEQVAVPKPGEEVTAPPGPVPGVGGSGGSAPGGSASPPSGAPVNINQADATALEELPGVGPVLAGRIVQWRTDNGRFTVVDELAEVSGIGEKMLAQLRPLVTV